MYINYLNREHFQTCDVDFNLDKKLGINECANYTDEEYTDMRNKYMGALVAANKAPNEAVCLKKLKDNINTSRDEQTKYNEKIDEIYSFYTETHLEKIKNNKQKMEDLRKNIVGSEQRLKDSKGNNYRNKVKLIIFIVAIIVFVLIELILIIV
jgi:hypothetical protein